MIECMSNLTIMHGHDNPEYLLSPDHPMQPLRYRLAYELIEAYGLLERPDVCVLAAGPASAEQVARVHTPAYMLAVQRYGKYPVLASSWEAEHQWGITGPKGDTPAVERLHERALGVCGVAVAAALEVWEGRSERAIAIGGGLHHAFAHRAQGFCVYNDPAVAIAAVLDAGAQRVAYVDIDAHHGDGTQWIYYDDPRVLTCSVHESGKFLFPGTGFLDERGEGAGIGTSVNVPLPAFAGDAPYLRAIEEVVMPAVLRFRPDILIVEPGWDGHMGDALTHLQVTIDGFQRGGELILELAQEATGGRMALIGGGGYNGGILERCTALLVAQLLGVELPEMLPDAWLARSREIGGKAKHKRLRYEPPQEVPAQARADADAAGHAIVDEAIRLMDA